MRPEEDELLEENVPYDSFYSRRIPQTINFTNTFASWLIKAKTQRV